MRTVKKYEKNYGKAAFKKNREDVKKERKAFFMRKKDAFQDPFSVKLKDTVAFKTFYKEVKVLTRLF